MSNQNGIIEKNGNYQIRKINYGEYLIWLALWLSIFIEVFKWLLTKYSVFNVLLVMNRIPLLIGNVIIVFLNIAQIKSREKAIRILCFFLDFVIIHENALYLVFKFPWPITLSLEYIYSNYEYLLILIAFVKTINYFYYLCFVKTIINYYNMEINGQAYQLDIEKLVTTSISVFN